MLSINSSNAHFISSVPTDFGKRVYQGVRVKHTVKDLLAEKRSRQSSGSHFSGSISTPQSSFVQMPGSPTMAGYYGVRRSFTTELDFHNTKQFVSDVYSSPLGSRPFSSDSSATQGFPALLDPYLTDQYGDYRATPLTAGTSSFFSPSVPPLLPSLPNDTTHFLLREPWEQTSPDSLSQMDGACSDPLQALPASASCLSSHESGSISPYRSSGWTAAIPGAQPYPLHPLEDVHYSPSYASTSTYTFSPFMTVANELTSRMSHLSTEQSSETSPLHDNSAWAKEDGSPIWGTYEGRRTY
ncbi:POU domain class 2-associating factor 2 isoform X1 [Neopsephotus bourkii]|uniref:POU domain class 2-associating factor 2 isoform X1 n=2 Tax=Neopsephotus bourkii TaxID=309878 RepID=UPI002AA4F9B1|nr:POU domain class 2-associating factor 2 isoform X1 [Neopsephotus bourkii]